MAQPVNPYQPPVTDEPAASGVIIDDSPRPHMPGPVIGVVVLVSIMIFMQLFSLLSNPTGGAIQLFVAILILVGLIKGNALAWQWGRIIPPMMALFAIMALTSLAAVAPMLMVVTFLIGVVPNIAIPVLLSHPSARRYYGLYCPRCDSKKVGAADFVYDKRKCKSCGTVWKRR